ncbi:MAG: LysE family transporter [Pseudomonadota bacterium]
MILADNMTLAAFALAAIGLLGSPGPAIAALVAVGKVHGARRGLWFYGGLQLGLAAAAAVSAIGFVSLLTALPALRLAMIVIAGAYLLYLAWKIASAPIGKPKNAVALPKGGFVLAGATLGVTNPKAYIAFAALMVPVTLVSGNALLDATLKWSVVVLVMIVVDLLWLAVGVWLGRATMPPLAERCLNVALAAAIIAAAVLALL